MQIAPWVFPLTEESASVPPHVRGRELGLIGRRHQARITPACAGKSQRSGARGSRGRDHPRVCGEKVKGEAAAHRPSGSPPRVRGKVHVFNTQIYQRGITPACAGKSRPCPAHSRSTGDHPRVCGEKVMHSQMAHQTGRSPPRVRGKAQLHGGSVLLAGITPACAGKSLTRFCRYSFHWDHPRVCGEKLSLQTRLHRCLGSPPRVRGKEAHQHKRQRAHRITPACAGKRLISWQTTARAGDHPRVCGEKRLYLLQL